ncbi:MAG TPA: hypothetical protein VMV32_09960 [Ignavibacteriaceae bacterium]|nr:hypothetical protein [Ignavibacteriaceae bacterium]
MKKIILILFVGLTMTAFAQFKDSGAPAPNVMDGMINTNNNNTSLFGFLGSNNFQMKQSYSMSYSSFAGQGLALGVYTNNMSYQFNKNLNLELEASVVNAPYSTLGKSFQNSINGIYLNRVALNYQPWKDVSISIQYNHIPYGYYSPYSMYGGYGNSWYNDLGFSR